MTYRWTLTYTGATKTYQLTESRFVDGDWIPLRNTSWATLESAVNHITNTNTQRQKEAV